MDFAPVRGEIDTYPEAMAFRKTWRSYQARVLESLDSYLADGRLHLVAAPGSGKTVLGLEVIRRINKPTLVLAPTITIRNQWAERLVDLFLPAGNSAPRWISLDLKKPNFLTISTYQALHALCHGQVEEHVSDSREEDHDEPASDTAAVHDSQEPGNNSRAIELPQTLQVAWFRTLVVDEAHHLRAEWWKTLTFVVERLDKPTIVALTATPPYDVSTFEWQRYEELCGPVDAEVSVPELVQQGDLCPHQDYVYFSAPAPREQQTLDEFRKAVDAFVARLRGNAPFVSAISAHPYIASPDTHVEEILDNPSYLSSMAIFLHAVGANVSPDVLRVLARSPKTIPALDLQWMEVLLTNVLYADAPRFDHCELLCKQIRRELTGMGAIEHRRVKLQDPSDHTKLLTSSITKLHSIATIVQLEASALGASLRCVILTDFIRKSEMPHAVNESAFFEDVGIVPIFEALRHSQSAEIRLGVLSGSLVIVPESAKEFVQQAALHIGICREDLSISPLIHDPNYCVVELRGEYNQGTVRLITAVFDAGGINVLVGTKSLLGEGWDAPCINALILASFVGSYVLSNQMRGRSIRVDATRPEKTANIWHLVCIEPGLFGPGADYELLLRRCGAFVGVSATEAKIENGTRRLGLPDPPLNRNQIDEANAETCRRALDRAGLRQRWQQALVTADMKSMMDGLKAPAEVVPRGFVLANTIVALLMQAATTFGFLVVEMLRTGGRLFADRDPLVWLALVFGIPALICSPWVVQAVWRFIRHGTPEKSLRQIGRAILETLEDEGSVDRYAGDLRLYAKTNADGTVFCGIQGATGKEQTIYLRALREVLRPLDNPRYLLARKPIWRFIREDYFAVPEPLARKREFAETFARNWTKWVGAVNLVYTRTPEGRKILLRGRMHSLAAAFQKPPEQVSCWK